MGEVREPNEYEGGGVALHEKDAEVLEDVTDDLLVLPPHYVQLGCHISALKLKGGTVLKILENLSAGI